MFMMDDGCINAKIQISLTRLGMGFESASADIFQTEFNL